jgi:phosphohistidine phosphatase
MSLRLILMRHAKSAWDDPMMDDQDRPLTKRGRRSAKAIGTWLAERGCTPDLVLVSPSERTRETWMIMAKQMPGAPKPEFRDDLYHAEPEALLNVLRGATGSRVMILAHSPGIAYFAQALVAEPPADGRFERCPTGATTVIDFDDLDDWSHLAWRTGRVEAFTVPRDLVKD